MWNVDFMKAAHDSRNAGYEVIRILWTDRKPDTAVLAEAGESCILIK